MVMTMEKLKECREKLSKIEGNCRNCHAKMCNICPNNKMKIALRKEIVQLGGEKEKKNFWERLKDFIS